MLENFFIPSLKGYIFTLYDDIIYDDNDIIYDDNYISYMIEKINNYNRRAVITYHGGYCLKK